MQEHADKRAAWGEMTTNVARMQLVVAQAETKVSLH